MLRARVSVGTDGYWLGREHRPAAISVERGGHTHSKGKEESNGNKYDDDSDVKQADIQHLMLLSCWMAVHSGPRGMPACRRIPLAR